MRITTVIGARPQFIKAAVLSRALKNAHQIEEKIIHTGQHYDKIMSAVFFDELSIPKPDYNLGIGGGTHGQNTGRMIEKIESVLMDEQPDYILVYGDTNSTLAGALSAAKLHIPVIHIEAGLRSYNRKMPEEINRVLTDHIADLLFCPTQQAMDNLSQEGVSRDKIHLVGDVMYDTTLLFAEQAQKKSEILSQLNLEPKQYILATIHRQENTNNKDRLAAIMEGLSTQSKAVILPLHPRTANLLNDYKLTIPQSITVIKPVGYLDMVMLEMNSALIVTDSGGIQKESFFHKVPCVTCRSKTEWTELVELGVNKLSSPSDLYDNIQQALSTPIADSVWLAQPYGDGKTAEQIAWVITD